LFIPFLLIPSFAQDESGAIIIQPDSVLYGLDTLFDDFRIASIISQPEKALTALDVADERLTEVKDMVTQSKFADAQVASTEHDEMLVQVDLAVTNIESTDKTEELMKSFFSDFSFFNLPCYLCFLCCNEIFEDYPCKKQP